MSSPALLISYVALWALVLVQSVLILAMLRQIGVLHLRIAPAGARILSFGPEIGDPVSPVTLQDMENPADELRVCGTMDSDLFLLFVTPTCAVCTSLMPAIKPLMRQSNGDLRWGIVAFGGRARCAEFRHRYHLGEVLFAYAPEIRNQYKIAATPYALLIARDGHLISKGLVNHMEHLESIVAVLKPGEHIVTDPSKEVEHERI
ncbi:MAG: hypothetical protein HY000_34295 [Planctomycetes bacterium]|nr:hypothetical protein [Planctomycetota bacterium]